VKLLGAGKKMRHMCCQAEITLQVSGGASVRGKGNDGKNGEGGDKGRGGGGGGIGVLAV